MRPFQAPKAPPHNQTLNIPTRAAIRNSPLRGERVVLTPIDPADGPELWSVVESSRWHLQRWLPWVPFNNSDEASQRYAEACANDWDSGRAVRLGIREKKTGSLLGIVGLDSCIHLHRSCDLGYWLKQDMVGNGLMTEAASLCVEFGFRRLQAHRIRCAAATDNHKSLSVISRLRFHFEGIARQAEFVDSRWVDHAIFSRLVTDSD